MLVSGVFSSWLTVATMLRFDFVQQAKPRHVLQQHRGAERGRRGIADRQHARQVGMAVARPAAER